MSEKFVIKAVEADDGTFTPEGMNIMQRYASDWVGGRRNLALEREHPDLAGPFYDVRVDPELAAEHALPMSKSLERSLQEAFPPREVFVIDDPNDTTTIAKAGPHKYLRRFRGPSGKWVYTYAEPAGGGRGPRLPAKEQAARAARKDPQAVKEPVRYEGTTETTNKPWYKPGTPLKRHWVDRAPGMPMGLANPNGDDGGTFAKYGGNLATHKVSDPARAKLHDDIIASFSDKIPPVPPGQQKLAVVMMGGPASGKSTATQHMDLDDFVHVDPDAVKDHIPEMQQGLNLGKTEDGTVISAKSTAAAVHEESSAIASRIRKKAIDEGKHVLIDGTGKNADKHEQLIKHLQAKGYKVHLVMAHQSPDIAHELNKGRSTTGGRFVPKAVVDGAYAKIPHNFERLAAVADQSTMFDATRGHPPSKVWEVDGRPPPPEHKHHDAEFVQSFKQQFGPGKPGFKRKA